MTPSPVAIIGVSNLFREGLMQLLKKSRFTVVYKAETVSTSDSDMSLSKAEVAIFVMSRGSDIAGHIDQIRACRQTFPSMKIVLLTDVMMSDVLRDAAAAGAQAVLSNEITTDVLQRALELVMLGQQLFPGQPDGPTPPRGGMTSLVPFTRAAPAPLQVGSSDSRSSSGGGTKTALHAILSEPSGVSRALSLSERERQILRCLMDGAANKTIARQLIITEATVKVHIKGLLRKIRVTNRTQAAVWGLNNPDILMQPVSQAELPPPERDFLLGCLAAS